MRKLIIEEKAEQLVAEVARLLTTIHYRCKASNDLDRSADSALLCVGEAVAVFLPRKKKDKYDIARGEAGEVKKALIALVKKRKLTEEDIKVAYGLADEMCAILTTMIKNLEDRY
ncbi:MAG TPA: four helix bundle protein [Longimicrobiales bacterium]|nr:four helix bundle protein [Longimicrobiales bacterium]